VTLAMSRRLEIVSHFGPDVGYLEKRRVSDEAIPRKQNIKNRPGNCLGAVRTIVNE
jgi:hypothetical protein